MHVVMSIRAHFAELWHPEDVLDSLWGMLASPYATALLLLSLAVLVCLGTLLPQRPATALADPATNGLWMASLRERYHGSASWMLSLGLFDLERSLWFRGLLGLLGFSLLVGAVDWIRPRHAWPSNSPLETTLSGLPTKDESTTQFIERVKNVLQQRRYRVLASKDGPLLYADRYVLFPVLVYLGLLLVIAGAALSERTAWWEDSVDLRPGQVRALGHGTGLALRAEVLPAAPGTAQPEHVALTFLRQEREIARGTLHARTPAFQDGLLFFLSSTQPAVLVQAQDEVGRSLPLQMPETGASQFTELALHFREEESSRYIVMLNLTPGSPSGRYFQQKGNEQYVLVPGRDLSLRVVYGPPPAGESQPVFQVEAFRNGESTPLFVQQFQGSTSLEIAGDRFTFQPHRDATVRFGQDYGIGLVLVGAAMALAGLFLSAWHPVQRLWFLVRCADNQASLACAPVATAGHGPSSWQQRLTQELAADLALQVPGAS
jgi:hypothetical protein